MKVGAQNVVAVYLGEQLVWSDGKRLRGKVEAQSSLTGALGVHRGLAGSVSGAAILAGQLTFPGQVDLGGTITGQSSLAGALGVSRDLGGTVSAQSQVAGAVNVEEVSGVPNIVNKSSGTISSTTSNVLNLPGSHVNGNKLVVLFGITGQATVTTPANWTLVGVGGTGVGSTDRKLYVFERVLDSSWSANTTVTITTASSGNVSYAVYQVHGAGSATLIAGTGATGVNPDPPNNNPGTSAETLWIIGAVKRQGSTLTGPPSGYANDIYPFISNAAGGFADKTSTASSEDPATFTGSGSDGWGAVTLGFRA